MSPPPTPPTLSQSEAATACGVSTATIRRARRSGRIEGAYEDGHGGWRIPFPALIAAGLMPPTTPPVSPDTEPPATPMTPHDDTEQLRRELAEARHRAERAEAVAAERERTIEVLQRSLLMLERGHSDAAEPPPPEPAPQPQPPAKRGGLLGLLGF